MAIDGIFYVHAQVSDLALSKRFYGETLGWTLHTDEQVVAGFWFGSAYLVIQQDQRKEGRRSYTGGMHVAVRVDDLDAQHEQLKKRGVDVSPISERPWGERNFSFTDPDGHLWEYGEPST